MSDDASIDPKAAQIVVSASAETHTSSKQAGLLAGAESLFEKARGEALAQCAQYQPWDEDAFCLNELRVEVV